MERSVLHCDANKFYASVECLYHPEIRDKPVVVGGSEETRHGIVLTGNEKAKKLYGIKTGMSLADARLLCPKLIVMPPNYPRYIRFSKMLRRIYSDYVVAADNIVLFSEPVGKAVFPLVGDYLTVSA